MYRMRRKGARLCSILLALVLVLSLMPTQLAFASEASSETTLEVTQHVEDHEDEPTPAKETGGTDESAPKQEKKDDDEPATSVKSDDEEEQSAPVVAADDEGTQDSDDAEVPAPASSSGDDAESDSPASVEEPTDTSSEKTKSADPAEAGENDSAEDAPAASTDVDAAQDEEGTDADQPADPEEDTDSDEDAAQAREDEETDPSTENEEAPEGDADPEEIVEEGTVLPATPALGTRSLLTAQVAKAASGPACPNCGVNTFLSNSTDRYHNYTCQNENCTYRYQHVISEAHSGGAATCTEKAKCEVCGYEYGDPLGHDLHYSPAKEPTCTEIGWYEDYICYRQGCGMVFTDAEGKNPTTAEAVTRAALGHDWESDWSVDVDKGVHYHACSRCDVRLDEAEHSGGEGTATCTTGKKCEQCGERYGEVDFTRHASLTTAQSRKAPTCTEAGSNTVYRCNGCNHYIKADYKTITTLEDEVIPALGHSGGEGTATCTTGKKCDQCGERYGEVDLTRHASLTTAQSSKAPTCTEAGSNTVYRCNGCNHYIKADYKTITTLEDEVIPALSHDWGDWTADPDDGTSHYRVCKREGCGATETEKHHADSYKYWSSSIHYVKCMVCLEKTLWASEPHTLGNWQDNGDGTHTGKCVCGMTQTVEHTYGDWQDNGDDTHSRSCICGATETVAHTYTWTYVDDDTHKGVCVCGAETTEAHYDRWASNCGRQPHCEKCDHDYGAIPEHEMWYEDRGENGHKPSCYHCDTYFFLEAHSFAAATCVSGPTCEKCGAVYGDPDPDNHDWSEWMPDPDDANHHCRVCKRKGCGAKQVDLHHDDKVYRDETCHAFVCDVCGGTLFYVESHHFNSWHPNGNDTHSRECDGCGWKETEVHSGGTATCTSGPICEMCGVEYDKPLGHDLKETARVEPTCTESGTEAYWTCQRDGCGKLFSDAEGKTEITAPVVIKALGHDLKATARVEPTCTSTGTEAYWTCQRDGCGKRFSDGEGKNEITTPVVIKALGHDLKETARVEPTCTESGTEAYWTCQRDGCGKLFSDGEGKTEIEAPVIIPALGHDLVHHDAQAATCTEVGWEAYDTCSRCDHSTYKEIPALGHNLVHHDAQVATCTEVGWDAYDTCSRCDYSTYKEIPALGHDLVHHDAQAATCTEVGWNAYDTCSRCDYSTYKEIAALGHDLVHHDAQAATCTEVGWEAYDTCSRCNYSTYKEIPALGHDLKEIAKVEPTCTEAGTEAYWMCQRDGCSKLFSDAEGKTEIEAPVIIPAKGHTEVVDPAVPATCTETGLTEGKHCSVCNTVLVAQDVVPAKGHTPGTAVRENEHAATCTSAGGNDEVVYCTVCKAELSRESHTTPALGHDYRVTGRTITIISSTCNRCGHNTWRYNPSSRNLLDGLVRDGNDVHVDYSAGVSRIDGKWTLTVVPDLESRDNLTDDISLYLEPKYVKQWLRKGISTVIFQRDNVKLEIDLNEITPDWFTVDEDSDEDDTPLEDRIDFYVFTLSPVEESTRVDVDILIGKEKTSADTFKGLMLKKEVKNPDTGKMELRELEITENGVYDFE